MEFDYFSIESEVSEQTYKEKGSKFIGYLCPIGSTLEWKKKLQDLKKLHPKATHHCFAYRMGKNGENYRTNDDGEPSGSAGLPIYNQLLSAQITHVLLVVVRYYGGTKLGVNGLVKAYKECAKLCVSKAKIIGKVMETNILIVFPFAIQNQIFTLAHRFEAQNIDFQISEKCKLYLRLKLSELQNFQNQLNHLKDVTTQCLD